MTTLAYREPHVKLMSYADYTRWYRQVYAKASQLDVWALINPLQEDVQLDTPKAPARPDIEEFVGSPTVIAQYKMDYKRDHLNVRNADIPPFVPLQLSDLTDDGRALFKEDTEMYRIHKSGYDVELQR